MWAKHPGPVVWQCGHLRTGDERELPLKMTSRAMAPVGGVSTQCQGPGSHLGHEVFQSGLGILRAWPPPGAQISLFKFIIFNCHNNCTYAWSSGVIQICAHQVVLQSEQGTHITPCIAHDVQKLLSLVFGNC
jgi:hypothetical protein